MYVTENLTGEEPLKNGIKSPLELIANPCPNLVSDSTCAIGLKPFGIIKLDTSAVKSAVPLLAKIVTNLPTL